MDLRQKMSEAVFYRNEVKKASKEKFKDLSRKRLQKIIETKMKTCFIGDIANIEKFFGDKLWGHSKHPSQRTEDEQKWFDFWQLCRTEMLTNGNNQIRAIQKELLQYTINWDAHQIVILPGE